MVSIEDKELDTYSNDDQMCCPALDILNYHHLGPKVPILFPNRHAGNEKSMSLSLFLAVFQAETHFSTHLWLQKHSAHMNHKIRTHQFI